MAIGSGGIAEIFLPAGGTSGQVLEKTAAADYAIDWVNPGAGGSGITALSDGATFATGPGVIFSNSPTVSFGIAGNTITASAAGGAGGTPFGISAGTQSVSTGTAIFSNANGISFGMSGSNTITASYTVPTQSNQTGGIYASSQTFGQSSSYTYDLRSLTMVGSGGISLGWSNSSLLISGQTTTPQTAQTGISGIQVSDNTYTSGTVTFRNMNGISFGSSGANGISASYTVPAQTNQTGISGIQVSDNTYTSGTVTFRNLNGISFGSSGANGISASYTVPAAQTGISGIQVSDTTYTSGTVTFRNLNGISFGSSGANGISASYTVPTVPAQLSVGMSTNGNTLGNTGLVTLRVVLIGNNNITLSGSTNGGSMSISISGPNTSAQQTGISGIQVSDTTYSSGTVTFRNLNGISFGSSGANGISASYTVPVASNAIQSVGSATGSGTNVSRFAADDHVHAGVFSMGVSTGGNTDGNTRVDVGRFVFAGGANITLSMATAANALNTISVIGGAGAGGGIALSVPANGASRTSGGAGYSNISSGTAAIFGNNITLSQDGASITISANNPGAAAEANWVNLLGANTAGNTTASGSTIGWSGINLTLSGTNGSAVNISAPATSSLVGSSGISLSTNGSTITVGMSVGSYFNNVYEYWANSTTMAISQSTSHVQPFNLEGPISFGYIRLLQSVSVAASSTGVTTGNSQFSYGHSRTHNFVLYSRGVGASSQSLQSIASTSFTDQQSINVSAATNSTQFSYTNRATYQCSSGTFSTNLDYSSSAASLNFHTTNGTNFSGPRFVEFQWATSLAPGQYWLMYGMSSSTASQYTAQGTRLFNVFSAYGVSQPNVVFGPLGSVNPVSAMLQFGLGSFSTAGGGTTNSLPVSAVSSSGSHNKMLFQLQNIA